VGKGGGGLRALEKVFGREERGRTPGRKGEKPQSSERKNFNLFGRGKLPAKALGEGKKKGGEAANSTPGRRRAKLQNKKKSSQFSAAEFAAGNSRLQLKKTSRHKTRKKEKKEQKDLRRHWGKKKVRLWETAFWRREPTSGARKTVARPLIKKNPKPFGKRGREGASLSSEGKRRKENGGSGKSRTKGGKNLPPRQKRPMPQKKINRVLSRRGGPLKKKKKPMQMAPREQEEKGGLRSFF